MTTESAPEVTALNGALPERIEETKHLFPELDDDKIDKLSAYCRLVWEANKRVNLVSRKDAVHLYERHLWNSLAAIKYWKPKPGTTAIDVGTGGGFPGVPLAISFPDVSFTLLDSTRKKIESIDAMLKEIGVFNARPLWQRAEEHPEKYDCVWGRGVSVPPDFFRLAAPLLNCKAAPVCYLTGGSDDDIKAWKKAKIRVEAHNLHAVLPHTFFETKFLLFLGLK